MGSESQVEAIKTGKQAKNRERGEGESYQQKAGVSLSPSPIVSPILSKAFSSSWLGQKGVRTPGAFPAMIAVALARLDKRPD